MIMFRTVFTKSLRDYRWAILGWGAGIGLLIYIYYGTVSSALAGVSAAELQQLVNQFKFFGETLRPDTPGGYVTFKILGFTPVLLGIWAALAGARLVRGEEERGSLDIVLSTPRSRGSVLLQKVLALVAALAIMAVLIGLGTLGGMASIKTTVDAGAAFATGVNIALAALVFAALALLLAQFTGRGAAASWTGGLMALFFVLDGTGRATPGADGLRYFSPWYYYDLSTPLVPGYGISWGGLAVLLALSVVFVGVSIPLFLRRDIGRTALADVSRGGTRVRRATTSAQALAAAARDIWLRGIGLQAMRRQRTATVWWTVALAIIAGYMVIIARSALKSLQDVVASASGSPGNSSLLQQLLGGNDIGTNSGFLAAIVFGYLPVAVAVFAGLLAYRWPSDLDNGRLEIVLSTPQPRWRVVVERFASVLVAVVLVSAAIWLTTVVFAQAANFAVDTGRVAAASFGMLPLGLVTAGLVYALTNVIPPVAVLSVMTLFVVVSFVTDLLREVLNLPEWVLNLSIFHQYGTPVMNGLNWGGFTGMLLIALALLLIGVWQFSARDVDRGAAES